MDATFQEAEPCSDDTLRRHGQLSLDALTFANAHGVHVHFHGPSCGVTVVGRDGRTGTAMSLPDALKVLGLWGMP